MFLLIGNIDGVDLCVVNIELDFYFFPIFYLSQFNISKSVMYTIEKSAVG